MYNGNGAAEKPARSALVLACRFPHPLYVVSAASEKTTTCSYQRHNGAGTSAVRKNWGFTESGKRLLPITSASGTQQPLRCKALRQLNLMGQI